jgi:medium-chain acyl-[acyl-carrier-protein] hydrolase
MEAREAKFTVRTYECQVDGSIKIASLMQYLQEVASVHAEELGFGYRRMNEIEGYWVLSNIRIEIAGLPKWNDQITIKTWPSGYTRSIATREFVGKDRNDTEWFRAGSEWMVLDRKKNRPRNLFRIGLGLPKSGSKAIPAELNRLAPPAGCRKVERVRVPYSSIDLNGHVNNTEYVRWGIDALRRAFKLEGSIRSVHATFLAEVFEGDQLDLLVSRGAGADYRVLIRRPGQEDNVYLMEVGCARPQ